MNERWKDVKGYEGIYKMDILDGEIINIKRMKRKPLKPALNNGYPRIVLSKGGKRKAYQISQLYVDTFYPELKNEEILNMIKRAINKIVASKIQNN